MQNMIAEDLILQCKRYNRSNLNRIENCLSRLSTKEIWYSPNSNTNSIGNLVLHLCGNITQYIISGLGKEPDHRERDQEFIPDQGYEGEALMDKLSKVIKRSEEVMDSANDTVLSRKYRLQGFDLSGTEVILHVCEHLSYHVGQIALLTKLLKDEDLGFYSGKDLNARNE